MGWFLVSPFVSSHFFVFHCIILPQHLATDPLGLFRIVAGGAYKHRGHNSAWLLFSHVQEGIASTAHTYRLEALWSSKANTSRAHCRKVNSIDGLVDRP